jgi:hypothetical protein
LSEIPVSNSTPGERIYIESQIFEQTLHVFTADWSCSRGEKRALSGAEAARLIERDKKSDLTVQCGCRPTPHVDHRSDKSHGNNLSGSGKQLDSYLFHSNTLASLKSTLACVRKNKAARARKNKINIKSN